MKLKNFLYLLILVLVGCNFEAEEESSDGLISGHKSIEDRFTIELPNNGIYGIGQNLDFKITHPAQLIVTGNPEIAIEVGEDTRIATFVGGSGSKTLTFRYTLQAGESDDDGIEVSSNINLSGSTIQYSSGGAFLDTTTQISNLPISEILVVTSSPQVISNIPPVPRLYREGDFLYFVMTFNRSVVVSGNPSLSLDIGGVSKQVNYLTGSGGQSLIFRYNVLAIDSDFDGVDLSSPINLNSGTIRDLANNNADLVFTPANTSFVLVNGSAPYVSSLNLPVNRTYFAGEIINFDLVFSEVVNVLGGIPLVELNIGGVSKNASYFTGSGSNTLSFQYVVDSNDLDDNGIAIGNLLILNGASVKNATGDDAITSYVSPLTPNVLAYGATPSIVSITPPLGGDYLNGSNLDFRVKFSEDVIVTSFPRLQLNVGGNTFFANFIGGSGTRNLTFRYTAATEMDIDGITFETTSVDLNGSAFIQSEITNNDAILDFSGVTPSLAGITINGNPPTQLVIVQEPVDTAIDSTITPSISIEIRDASNALATGATNDITLSFGFDPNGDSSLSGTLTKTAVGGVATFDDISIDKLGENYTLTVSSTTLTSDTSVGFDITPLPPTDLRFSVSPSNSLAGVANSPAIQVEVIDTNGNLVTSATNSVNLTFATDPSAGSAVITGTTTINAVGGIATFSDISIDKAFVDYELLASSSGLNSHTSASFDILANTASALFFKVAPTDAEILTSIAPVIEVEIHDAYGNKTLGTSAVTLAINNDPAGLSVLAGTLTANAVDGVASFSDISIDKAGNGFNLIATTTGLTSQLSSDFNITTTPVALRISTEPTNTNSGETVAPGIVIEVIDVAGNVVLDATNAITVAFDNDASLGAGTLAGTLTQNAVNGVATFSDLSIDSIAAGYTLDFSSTGLTSITSSAFDITSPAATKVSFTVQPTNTVAGESITPSIRVELLDATDTLVTSATNSVTLSFGTDPSSGNATLGGTITKNAVGGVILFDDISVDKIGLGYTLTADASGLTSDTSTNFDISVAAAAKLNFKTQPSNAEVLADITPAIEVEVQDAFGNLTNSTDTITIAIGNDPHGSSVLAGTLSVAAVDGIATFSDLDIDRAGVGFTLDASAASLTSTTSATFDISSTPVALRVLTEPSDTDSLAAINPAIKVELIDAAGNVVLDATNSITVDFGSDPSVGTANLSGTLTVSAVAGIASFSNLSIDVINDGYTFNFTSTGLTGVTSELFDINQPPPTQLAFKVEPSNTVAGVNIASSIEVEILDGNGNLVTNALNPITLAFQADPSGGVATLSGTLTVTAVAGVATFNNINIDKAHIGYTLSASATGLTTKVSAGFDITHAQASKLSFSVSPTDENEGININPAVEVSILDEFDNIALSATNNIVLSFGTDPSSGNATLSGTLSQNAVAGVATFNDINLDFPSTGYTLNADSTGLTSATSDPFDIYGVPTKLKVTVQPTDTQLGNNISDITIHVHDSANGLVGNATNNITLSLISDPSNGSASFSGTLTRTAVNGIAVFSGVNLDEAGANYIIRATSPGLEFENTIPFNITITSPTSLTLITPLSSPSDDTTPTVRVGGLVAGDLVKIYTDAACSGELVGSFTSDGTTADITTVALSEGVYVFHAKRITNSGTPSACSSVSLDYEVAGSFYQLDSFANTDFGNWSNVGGDDRDWSTNTGNTPSANVGPTAASSGTHYLYTEASSPVVANDEFYLESNVLDGSVDDLAINFDWNKRGDNMGNLILEASNNGGSTWAEVWRHDGVDVATGDASIWRNNSVDLCDAGYTSSNIKLRFRAVMPAGGSVWNSDIALDEIELNSGGCSPGTPASLDISTPTVSTAVGVLNESAFEVSGTCSDNGENVVLSGDVSGSTICNSNLWSIILDLSAYPDGAITINADHTASSGGANGVDSVTVTKDSLSIQFDDMTTFGNWANVGGDDRDWSINTGETPSNNVGPTSGQGGGGNYLYTEASNPVTANQEFIVESNSIDAGLYNIKFDFFWNKRGDNMGDLHLEVSTDGGSTWSSPIWEHIGQDVASGPTDVWRPESIDLCDTGYNSGNIKLRFRAVMPAAGNIWNSDIAIDSLRFTNSGCP